VELGWLKRNGFKQGQFCKSSVKKDKPTNKQTLKLKCCCKKWELDLPVDDLLDPLPFFVIFFSKKKYFQGWSTIVLNCNSKLNLEHSNDVTSIFFSCKCTRLYSCYKHSDDVRSIFYLFSSTLDFIAVTNIMSTWAYSIRLFFHSFMHIFQFFDNKFEHFIVG